MVNLFLNVYQARASANGAASGLRACVGGRFGFVEGVFRDKLRYEVGGIS